MSTPEAILHNQGDYDKATQTQAKMLGSAIERLSRQGDAYHDEGTGIDSWGFSKQLDPSEVQRLPDTITQHFPEADGPIERYDLITLWSPMASQWRTDERDFVAIERTTVHPTWREVAAIKYELGAPTANNPSGIKRDVTVSTTAILTQPTGAEAARELSEDEVVRLAKEAHDILDSPHPPGVDEHVWSDEFDDLSGLELTEASRLISFVRGVASAGQK